MQIPPVQKEEQDPGGCGGRWWGGAMAGASGSRTDREITIIQVYYLGLTSRKLRDYGKRWRAHLVTGVCGRGRGLARPVAALEAGGQEQYA